MDETKALAIATLREKGKLGHYHVIIGLHGSYSPSQNFTCEDHGTALRVALEEKERFRDEGAVVTGNIVNDGRYLVNQNVKGQPTEEIRIAHCDELECWSELE